MQQHIHTIVKHFFQKDNLQEVPEQVLQHFTEQYPYSAVGQWLLTRKIYDTAPERVETQAAQSVAWFTNPLWLHWTLQEHEPVAETLLIPSQPKDGTLTDRVVPAPVVLEEPAPAVPEEPVAAAPVTVEETVSPVAAPAEPASTAHDTDEETEIYIPGVAEPVSLIEEAPAPVAPPPPVEAEAPTAEPPPAAELKDSFKPVISDSEEPIFEPYHTIDYFASQGIKLRQEDLKDKLGMQLKSFTEWLRGMKRIAPVVQESAPDPIDDSLQQTIQTIAGHSVEGKEVVTEAMAEVWVKQGSKQKAIAIYEKLSLLNPAKSPYFASRIDQIKAM